MEVPSSIVGMRLMTLIKHNKVLFGSPQKNTEKGAQATRRQIHSDTLREGLHVLWWIHPWPVELGTTEY